MRQEGGSDNSRVMVNSERVISGRGCFGRSVGDGRFDRGLDQPGDHTELDPAIDECSHGDLVGSVIDRRGAASGPQGFEGQPQPGEPLQVRSLECQLTDRGEVKASRRTGDPVRPAQAMGDRRAHVGRTKLGHHRAVDELDHTVNDGLRMNQHIDLVGGQREQVRCLDHLEALVHH